MRTTVTLDEALIEEAKELSGLHRTSDVLEAALRSFIAHQSALRLIKLGGSDPNAAAAPRRRFD